MVLIESDKVSLIDIRTQASGVSIWNKFVSVAGQPICRKITFGLQGGQLGRRRASVKIEKDKKLIKSCMGG